MLLKSLIEIGEGRTPGAHEAKGVARVNPPTALPPDFLSSMCEIEDRKPQLSRLSEDTDYIHVSSLLDLCPRQYALAKATNLKHSERVGPAQKIVWEMGKALEAHAIKNIQQYHGKHLVHPGAIIKNDEYMIQGAPDLIVETGVDLIVEIKTINARDFKQLEEPRGDHVLQAAMYRWLVEQDKNDVHDHVIILYIAKDFIRGESPYKEFQVDTNQPHIQAGVTIALELAKELKDARSKGLIPKRRVCLQADCYRSKICPVAAECWNRPEEEHEFGNIL